MSNCIQHVQSCHILWEKCFFNSVVTHMSLRSQTKKFQVTFNILCFVQEVWPLNSNRFKEQLETVVYFVTLYVHPICFLFRMVWNKEGLKFSGTHQLLVCADDVVLEDNLNTLKKKTKALRDISKEVGVEINTEKSKYIFMSCHQNAGQNHNIKVTNWSFENVGKFAIWDWQ
jgi:hypothetical protein